MHAPRPALLAMLSDAELTHYYLAWKRRARAGEADAPTQLASLFAERRRRAEARTASPLAGEPPDLEDLRCA